MDFDMPDMDDLLDQLEASVAGSSAPETAASATIRPAAAVREEKPRAERPSEWRPVSGGEDVKNGMPTKTESSVPETSETLSQKPQEALPDMPTFSDSDKAPLDKFLSNGVSNLSEVIRDGHTLTLKHARLSNGSAADHSFDIPMPSDPIRRMPSMEFPDVETIPESEPVLDEDVPLEPQLTDVPEMIAEEDTSQFEVENSSGSEERREVTAEEPKVWEKNAKEEPVDEMSEVERYLAENPIEEEEGEREAEVRSDGDGNGICEEKEIEELVAPEGAPQNVPAPEAENEEEPMENTKEPAEKPPEEPQAAELPKEIEAPKIVEAVKPKRSSRPHVEQSISWEREFGAPISRPLDVPEVKAAESNKERPKVEEKKRIQSKDIEPPKAEDSKTADSSKAANEEHLNGTLKSEKDPKSSVVEKPAEEVEAEEFLVVQDEPIEDKEESKGSDKAETNETPIHVEQTVDKVEEEAPSKREAVEVVEFAVVDEADEDDAEERPEEPKNCEEKSLEEEQQERKRSVIASTHDISVETEGRLTESELLLGKVKPYWIPDEECSHCMLCESKFNVLNRRHHCRACGRVLCSKCCSHRRELVYMPDPIVKHRVCEPCLKTLEKIDKHEIENGGASSSNGEVEEEAEVEGTEENGPGTSGETSAPAPIEPEQAPRTTKSALKIRKPDPEDPCSSTAPDFSEVLPKQSKRSVTFLDGVNPGEGGEDVTAAEALARATSSTNSNKPKKKSARRALSAHRMREMRIEEEPMCMFTGGSSVFVPKDDGTLEITDVASVEDELASGLPIVVALKRNLHAVVQLCDLKCCNQGRVICVSSRGIHAIGADEVVFVFEHSEGAEVKLPSDVLRKVDEIYMTCLDPLNSTADEKVGIRMVRDRMLKLYRVDNGSLDGFDVTRILLFKPTSQCLEHLPLPSTSFYFACYIKRSEVIWSLALPQRVLYKIGFQASCFPAAIVNKWNREPVYADQDYESSVLKVFTDFRNFSYRLSSIPGSTISLSDGAAIIELPTWAAEKVTTAVNANRNMIAWAADLNSEADSILVCEQDVDSASFKSSMFAKVADQRSVTGCSFVIFDGALKTLDDTMHVSIVEDGIVIRLRSTVMSSLVEKLLAGQDFEVESKAMNLSIRWVKSAISEKNAYTTRSPIDGFCLEEQWQYGALLTRELRSLMPLQSATEWSLRLASVINIFEDKFPTALQSKIFSICEEVAKLVSASLSPFISILIENSVRTIVVRIQLSQDSAEYQTALWPGLDDIHAVWIVTLDDQVAPVLFNICSHLSSAFCAELHLPIVSSRPLPELPNAE